jgi:serine/threonine-protein kinase
MGAWSSSMPVVNGSWYELLARIRSGAAGTVHVARRRGSAPTRWVAVKRMHPHLARDPAVRRSMLGEARIGQLLWHPNAVAVHEVEDLGDELLLAMDYIEGGSVADLMRTTPRLPPRVVVRMLLDAAAGLAALHQLRDERGAHMGAVHRDVAPENLLVGVDGLTRIADFGVARVDGGDDVIGDLKGRFGYMAPEHLMGYACDARSDVHALAVVGWELLTGRSLFKGSTDAVTMQRVLRLPAPRISAAAPGLGSDFDAVFAAALAKSPTQRMATMATFANELAAAAAVKLGVASPAQVGITVDELVGDTLWERRVQLQGASMSSSGVFLRP